MDEQQKLDFDGTIMERIMTEMFNLDPEYTINVDYCRGLISEYYESDVINPEEYKLLFKIVDIFT